MKPSRAPRFNPWLNHGCGRRPGRCGEWIAAALQDNRAAVIVGHPTAGNAFISTFIPVPGEDEFLQLATGVFERPSGRPFQRLANRHGPSPGGIIPDRIPQPDLQGVWNAVMSRFAPGSGAKQREPRGTVSDVSLEAAIRELTSG